MCRALNIMTNCEESQGAASVAALLITTEAMVAEHQEAKGAGAMPTVVGWATWAFKPDARPL
jgi:hypothetical protein